MTLRDHTLAWLDSIGADGLMNDGEDFIHKDDLGDDALDEFFAMSEASQMVPAYRHADGTYHTEPDKVAICEEEGCAEPRGQSCEFRDTCKQYQSWLAHKEDTK